MSTRRPRILRPPGRSPTLDRSRILLTTLLMIVVGCLSQVPTPDYARTSESAHPRRIIVLLSAENRVFDVPLGALIAQSNARVEVFTLTRWGEAALRRELLRRNPDLIVTFGAKATWWVAHGAPDHNHLFVMVVNHARLNLQPNPRRMGIAFEPSLAAEFAQFKMVLPHLKRVGVFYSKRESSNLFAQALEEWKGLNVELEGVAVESPTHIEPALPGLMKRVDALWLLSDPLIIEPQTFALLRQACQASGRPLVASLSETFARNGALIAVSPDLTALGAQAASMAAMVLEGRQRPEELGIQAPIGSRSFVNPTVAEKLNLKIPPEIYPFLTLVENGTD